MACEGRARNRMLRKRQIVRNPVVGEDDVTQLILARPCNTSWPGDLPQRVAKREGNCTFYVRGRGGDGAAKCGGVMTQGFRCCFRNLTGI